MIYKRRCYRCGSPTEANTPKGKIFCDECKYRNKKPIEYHHDTAEYRIVFDPMSEDEGGFSPGAYISCVELRKMCQADIRAFAAGTIIVNTKGKQYIITDRLGSNAQAVIAVVEPHPLCFVTPCDGVET